MTQLVAPETLSVCDTYIAFEFDVDRTAGALGMDRTAVLTLISTPAMQSYIAGVFFNTGYLNKSKFFGLMETLVDKKLEEMQESEMGSSKDIIDIMMALHKMKMEELKLEVKKAEIANSKPAVAVQINNNGETSPEQIASWAKVIGKITNRGKK